MLTVVYLGTGAAVPSANRENTSLAIDDGTEITLIDTSGTPHKRFLEMHVPHERLARVIITHEHPDHTFGFPSLLQNLWLTGRRDPLPVYALDQTWKLLDRLIAAYWPQGWDHGFPIERHTLLGDGTQFVQTPQLSLSAARGDHSVPCIGIRAEFDGGSVVYSSDTGPSDAIVALSRGCTALIHESTFVAGQEELAGKLGHSTSRQAAEVADRAGASRLALVHFTPSEGAGLDALRAGAAEAFTGIIDVPNDGDRLTLG